MCGFADLGCQAEHRNARVDRCSNSLRGGVQDRMTDGYQRLMEGSVVDGRYKVLDLLGEGGMGSVYKVEHIMLRRQLAMKVLRHEGPAEDSDSKRFYAEAKALSELKSRHTVGIHDFGKTDANNLYYIMDFVTGCSLRKRLETSGPIPWEEALCFVLQIIDSLEEAHGAGIVHRDLKPDNVQIGLTDGFVTVLDFGIAKVRSDPAFQSLTQTGMILGTPAYMSPEQILGEECTASSDIYSLGVMMFEMLTGKLPFWDQATVKLLLLHLQEPAPSPSGVRPDLDVPPELDRLVLSCLGKTAAQRPSSMAVLREKLQWVLQSASDHARGETRAVTLGLQEASAGALAGGITTGENGHGAGLVTSGEGARPHTTDSMSGRWGPEGSDNATLFGRPVRSVWRLRWIGGAVLVAAVVLAAVAIWVNRGGNDDVENETVEESAKAEPVLPGGVVPQGGGGSDARSESPGAVRGGDVVVSVSASVDVVPEPTPTVLQPSVMVRQAPGGGGESRRGVHGGAREPTALWNQVVYISSRAGLAWDWAKGWWEHAGGISSRRVRVEGQQAVRGGVPVALRGGSKGAGEAVPVVDPPDSTEGGPGQGPGTGKPASLDFLPVPTGKDAGSGEEKGSGKTGLEFRELPH